MPAAPQPAGLGVTVVPAARPSGGSGYSAADDEAVPDDVLRPVS